ncbi:hypothetical protein H9Q69_008063 [Fusarium xylarioides]|uniref:Uncharacterized protein n=1 Tax=Fusarium xylarioides TaxID=221167 RepID=A0A9P7ILS2_9HYPO|nr:hypothetical protein H9Q70_002125 [Fusarium xylarioides]KAG5772123.1 hypothetical protein H9Q72_001529 [Fusarium xylarioides]KAG5784664.1 hypothetical protein H9Q73_001728 [Fusarium xylarioides]KAG5792891.1 hypothetical protein H9Q69_008063 [Fusarium xylarioides]KAG5809962.1 hypothetical protein H9Q71_005804 [Fusarium xylarioides]
MHHLLSGVGGSCESTERVNGVARRDSSISLEESAYRRDNPEPSRTPLVPLESQKIEDRHDPDAGHGCTLPIPSPSSSPSVVAPIDVYLRCGESQSLEARLIGLGAILSQGRQTSEPENISPSPEASSWDIVNTPQTLEQKVPSTPVLQPIQSPQTTGLQPTTRDRDTEVVDRISVGPKTVSDLLLSDASQAANDHTEEYKEALIKYHSAKRSGRKDKVRIHKDLKKRSVKKRIAKSKSV